MSAPLHDTPVTTSASGYEDGFGRRQLAFEHEDGAALERLYLRPQFSLYERSLRDTFARLACHNDGRIVAARTIERDRESGELIAIAPFVSGERLSDLLEAAAERTRDDDAVPGIDVALGFLLEVLPTLDRLRAATGISHGAIAPPRCVFTSDGRVVLTECGFAAVLQRLNLSRERLWREFSVAIPPVAGAARFDETADISQAALMAVMLILGRPMSTVDAADVLPDWLADVVEIAQIRGSVSFAVNLQRFLQRALPLPGRRPYQTIDAALRDVGQLATTIGADLCRAALVQFVRHASGTTTTTVDAGWEADARAERVHVVVEVPATEPFVPAPVPIAAGDVLAPEPFAVNEFVAPEPIAAEATTFEPVFETEETPPDPVAIESPPPEPEPEPIPEPAPTRRRSWRSRWARQDALRSTVAAPATPEPAPVPLPVSETPVVMQEAAVIPIAAPEPVVPAIVAPLPLVAQPTVEPVVLQPLAAQPAVPQPVFAPLPPTGADAFWATPVAEAPQPPIAPKVRPVSVAPAPPAPLKLKADPPAGFTGRAPRREREVFASYGEPRPGATDAGPGRLSWKFAAAAAVVMVTVIAAGRAYLPDAPAVNAEAKNTAKPATVAAPPPVTTGMIVVQTQPPGARVLLDGSPAGETPLRIVDVAPGRHVLTFVTASATVRRTVKVEANKTLTLDVPVFSGWVAVFAPIVLEVSEEGRALGSTDQGRLLLPPGRHTLTLTNRDFGYSADHAVEIEAGEVRSLNVQPTGTVNLNAVPWAEVWIDGKKTGDTPLANLSLPLGNREIIFRHPEFGERKIMTRITAGTPVAVSVDFSR